MEILNNFGFNPMLFTAQIINFVIVFFVLKKILYKPVLDILKKRDAEIKKGLKDKEDAEILLRETQEKEKQILQKAQAQAEKIIADARAEANESKDATIDASRKEAERMINQAMEIISQETKIAEDHLTAKIGGIAIGLLEKSLTGIFGKKEQDIILKKAEEQLKKQNVI